MKLVFYLATIDNGLILEEYGPLIKLRFLTDQLPKSSLIQVLLLQTLKSTFLTFGNCAHIRDQLIFDPKQLFV